MKPKTIKPRRCNQCQELARLRALIVQWDHELGRFGPIHDEAEAIKARQPKEREA